MRNFQNFNTYLDKLQEDVYPQPPDDLQMEYARWVINEWIKPMTNRKTVLDVGCGQGQFAPLFQEIGMRWTGVTLGNDYHICKDLGLDCYQYDFSFLDAFPDESFDMIFSRHSLEHSPFPLLTLMEWNRVCKYWLCVIIPNPRGLISRSHVGAFRGRNHYSVMYRSQFLWLAQRAGFEKIFQDENDFELRFMLRKGIPKTE